MYNNCFWHFKKSVLYSSFQKCYNFVSFFFKKWFNTFPSFQFPFMPLSQFNYLAMQYFQKAPLKYMRLSDKSPVCLEWPIFHVYHFATVNPP